jgi:pimeloyl-ACP methyl ester carboxylesterase
MLDLANRRLLSTFAAIAVLLLTGAQASAPDAATGQPGVFVRLADGRRLYLRCSGDGAPTVLLEGGFAATSLAWVRVQPLVARTTRVCSYDRAGYGLSDPGPMPRDGLAVARDLEQALRRARVHGPFVLVGHSSGALYMRLFADRRPRDVVGMILVDPSIPHQDQRVAPFFGPDAGSLAPLRARAERCLAAAEAGALPSPDPALLVCTPRAAAGHPQVDPVQMASATRADNWRTQISELDTLWGPTSDEVDAGRKTYGDMPLIVLTAGGADAPPPSEARRAATAVMSRLHAEIAAQSTRGVERLVTGSTHMMMFDRPDAICAAIDEVVDAARKTGAPRAGAEGLPRP